MAFGQYNEGELVAFRRACERRLGVRLESYSDGLVERSVCAAATSWQCNSLSELFERLAGERESLQEFIDRLGVNVTQFFRDAEVFRFLGRQVLPDMVRSRSVVRIWCAGCATGEEPYSLSMILEEVDPGASASIVATDVDRSALAEARRAVYARDRVQGVTPGRLQAYFERTAEGFRLREAITRRVRFREHDLLREHYPRHCYDLIACRNVTIHLKANVDAELHERFVESLRPGGVLCLGGGERLREPRRLQMERIHRCCYRKHTGNERPMRRTEPRREKGRQRLRREAHGHAGTPAARSRHVPRGRT